ncbi:hypothetical protein ACH4F6_21570 [Streptomyces sp. NPDC017936]|uniref:hypothetical protein n=1 Tax=Streptomyces sp. NPDC017936 TaxID=3365016 RepID=UPI0037B9E6B9
MFEDGAAPGCGLHLGDQVRKGRPCAEGQVGRPRNDDPAQEGVGEARTSNETTRVRRVAPEGLAELDVHPTMRVRIEHALDRTRTAPYTG